jgi:hypothetical protein
MHFSAQGSRRAGMAPRGRRLAEQAFMRATIGQDYAIPAGRRAIVREERNDGCDVVFRVCEHAGALQKSRAAGTLASS